MGQLAKLVANDIGMTSKILSFTNSSAYNRSQRKLDLAQSLNTLGTEMIKTLVISESIFQTFNRFSSTDSADLHGFWVHALKAAVIARELAKKMAYPNHEEAYLAGLLHDVGRLALLSAAPDEYASNFIAQDDERLCSVESSSMGVTHAEAGAWLIERWNLDSFLADSVLYHHEPIARLQAAHPLIRIVCLAHLLSSYSSESPALKDGLALCGVDEVTIKTILAGATAQTKTAAAYFDINLADIDQAPPSAKYEPLEPVKNRAPDKFSEEVRNMALISAAGQSFARMENGRALLESIARTARVLFNLEDVVVLLQNANSQTLVGFPIGEHQQRLSEFSIPLSSGGIIAESVFKKRATLVGPDNSAMGIVDEQLLRLMHAECLAYLPMIAGQSCLGVLVYGLSDVQLDELFGRERFLQSFATQAATSLELCNTARGDIDKHIALVVEEHQEASRRVIHEVNNPLSIIKNYLGVLDDKLASNEPVIEELSILNEEIDRVSRIVGGLAKPQAVSGEDLSKKEITEVNGVLNEVVRLFSMSRFLPTSVNIVVKTADQPAKILAAKDTLKQIMLNLIKNAIEALPKGGTIEVRNNGRKIRDGRIYLEVCISDSGTGIPANVLANLFSSVRSDKPGENRGRGLSIVKSLVNEINGLISCDSGNRGTTFEILLPVYEK